MISHAIVVLLTGARMYPALTTNRAGSSDDDRHVVKAGPTLNLELWKKTAGTPLPETLKSEESGNF